MKYKFLLILAVLIAVQGFWGCKKSGSGSPVEGENFDYDASYALGMNIGASLGYDGIIPNIDGLLQGIKDQLSGGETKFDEGEARMILQEAYSVMMEKEEAEALRKENEFLAENSRKPGVALTASGLQYEIIREANGRKPAADNMVRVHYEGRLIDGTVFDSSYERGFPVEFPLGRVIPGWTEGVQLMGVGSKYKFYIPSELGYGPGGQGDIPPFATLIFEVELLDIIN
jgi:FKBP-type peptidyl-prolyl cis-trans isomerase